jgi:hypothetical protein
VDYGTGLTVNNGTLEADGSVGASSVFGRTGDVTAQSGDYSASQINGFDSSAVSAVESTYISNTTGEKWDVSLSSGEVLWDVNAHRPYEIKREANTSGAAANANLVFNSRGGGNAWEFAHNDTTVLELGGDDGIRFQKLPLVNGNKIWHDGNADSRAVDALQAHDGTGVNADTLDGLEGSNYARSDQDDTILGSYTFTGAGNGNVLVGTGNNSYDPGIQFNNTGNSQSAYWQIAAGASLIARVDDGSDVVVITQSGNTGFGGETTPSYPLDVNGDINASGVGRFSITGDAESVDGLDGFQIARTDTSEIFTDQVRIDGPLAGSDNEIGVGNNDYVLALGGRPHGVDDNDGTGDDRLGSGLLQTAHGGASDYRTYLQGGHGRVAHTWNAYYDSNASTWRSVVDNEPHTLVGIGNTTPGNVNGGGVTLAAADAVNTANFDNEQDAEDEVTWNVGLHVDVDGSVIVQGTDSSSGYTLNVDGSGDLVITTPTGNKAKILSNGDIEAFA